MAKKIILWVFVGLLIMLSAGLIILSCVSVDYIPKYSDPYLIFVYENGEQNTYEQVLSSGDKSKDLSYTKIYDDVKNAFKQNSFKALTNGTLFKNYKVNSTPNQTVDFSKGTFILFHYANFNGETQQIKNAKGDIQNDATYKNILIKVEPTEKDVELITFYLGNFSGTVFSYNYTYTSFGNLNQLVYDINL